MDFGIARVCAIPSITLHGSMMGTPGYMAPEQILGHPADIRADVYAVGAILYRLLAGEGPFAGGTTADSPPMSVRGSAPADTQIFVDGTAIAAREGDTSRFDSGELPALLLGGLNGAAAGQVLRGPGPRAVDPGVRDRLVEATAGNPLALAELTEVLSDDQLAGTAPLPNPLPLTGGVERAFLDRYRKLADAP